MYKGTMIMIFLALLVIPIYANVDALTIYLLRFTVADHDTHITRSFNVVIYDHDNDHDVTLDIPDHILAVIQEGCDTTTLSFPDFYTCKSNNMTVDIYCRSGFIVPFV